MNQDRRNAIIKAAQGMGVLAFGALIWSAYAKKASANSIALRPPGARAENEFRNLCIKCGRCVAHCPPKALKLAQPEDDILTGTPFFIARKIPCEMCVDVPCVPVCPTDALDEELLFNDEHLMDIKKAKMGVAIVDSKACVAHWGIQCDVCVRACPLIDSALKLEYKQNDRTNKHSFLLPVVDSNICTGCGLCERACITKKPAIIVLPRDLALGEVDSNYIKGWDKADEKRLENAPTKRVYKAGESRQKKSALDSLNNGEF